MFQRVIPFLLIVVLGVAGALLGYRVGIDYVAYDHAWRNALTNPSIVYGVASSTGGYYYYGPIFLILSYPFGFLPPVPSRLLWIALELLAYGALWVALDGLFPKVRKHLGLWLWGFLFSINSIHSNFQWLNIQTPLLAACLLSLLWSETKPRCAGVTSVLAGAVKVYPSFYVVFEFLFQKNRYRGGVILGMLLALLMPTVFFGVESSSIFWKDFIANLLAFQGRNPDLTITDLMTFPAVIHRFGHALGVSDRVIKIVQVGGLLSIGGGFLGLAYRAAKRSDWQSNRLGWASIALGLCVFLNVSSYTHYFVFYLPAFFWCLNRILETNSIRQKKILKVNLILATGLTSLTTDFIVGSALNHVLEWYFVPLWGTTIVMGTVLWGLIDSRE